MSPELLHELTWFDGVLLLVLLLGVFAGWRRGFMAGLAELIALVGSLALAWVAGPLLAQWAREQGWDLGVWALPAAFVVLYVIARLLLGMS